MNPIEIIKKIRRENNMTQEEMAKLMEMSQSAYSRLEKGDVKITFEQISKVAEIYGVPPVHLVDPNASDQSDELD